MTSHLPTLPSPHVVEPPTLIQNDPHDWPTSPCLRGWWDWKAKKFPKRLWWWWSECHCYSKVSICRSPRIWMSMVWWVKYHRLWIMNGFFTAGHRHHGFSHGSSAKPTTPGLHTVKFNEPHRPCKDMETQLNHVWFVKLSVQHSAFLWYACKYQQRTL